jgi:hypothetical protein
MEIAETYGIIQNLSGDSNIEITDNTKEQGLLLKPFQKISINRKVFARKVSGGGTAQLIVLPFTNSASDETEIDSDAEDYSYDENYFGENFSRRKKNRRRNNFYDTDWQRPPPPVPPPMFNPFEKNPEVVDSDGFYFLRIPKDSLNGQNKFLVQISDTKGND